MCKIIRYKYIPVSETEKSQNKMSKLPSLIMPNSYFAVNTNNMVKINGVIFGNIIYTFVYFGLRLIIHTGTK